MNSHYLFFNSGEVLEGLKDGKGCIYGGDRLAWIKNFPQIVLEIDEQLRKNFEIDSSRKLTFSYYDMQDKNKVVKIHDQKGQVVNRIVICSKNRLLKDNKGKKYQCQEWEAYEIPQVLNNDKILYIERQSKNKEFRNVTEDKSTKDDMVLVFEYNFNQKELDKLFKVLS